MKRITALLLMIIMSAVPVNGFAKTGGTRLQPTYTVSAAYASTDYYMYLRELELTGNQRIDIVNVALTQVGYHEGNTEADLDGSNMNGTGNVTEYNRWFGLHVLGHNQGFYYDWCAMFVSWVARQARIPESVINNATYAHIGYNPYYFHMSYHPRGTYSPKPGDLIFYDWAGSERDWEHVGIVAFVEDGMVHVVEGNAQGRVLIRVVSLDYYEIQGYGSPLYTNADASAVELSSYPVPTRNLGISASGNDVKWLQAALLHIGYSSSIDGNFGHQTRAKLIKFQQAHGLTADGIMGPTTKQELLRTLSGSGTVTNDPNNPSSYPVPTRTLRKGMKGNDVKWLQAALKKLGYSLTIDGDFGSATEAKVKAFQSANGLSSDGAVGPVTRNRLIQELHNASAIPYPEPARVLRRGMQGNDVKWLQTALTRLGYTLTVDGDFGSYTESAVRTFQRNVGLTADGVVGPATLRAIKDRL